MSSSHAPTHRPRERIGGDEEVGAELKLGDFATEQTLSLSEAKLVIDTVMRRRKETGQRLVETETQLKMQEYLDVFARFKRDEHVQAVANVLEGHSELDKFEKSQLGTLCCETSEEANTLIPSISGKMDTESLQELLNEIAKQRNFVD